MLSCWWNILWNTVMFKSCCKHGLLPPPSLLLISSSLSCLFPKFSLSLVYLFFLGWEGGGSITLSLTSHQYQTPPQTPTSIPAHFSPRSYIYLFPLVYPVACYFSPKPNPTHPLQESIFALPKYCIAYLENISRQIIDLKSVWSNAKVSFLVATRSIAVGAVLGVTMRVNYLSTLGSTFRSPILP